MSELAGGRLRSKFRQEMLDNILQNPDHRLNFLVDRETGKWLSGSMSENLPGVHAGHMVSKHSLLPGEHEQLAVHDARFNHTAGVRGERQGVVFRNVAVDIDGVPVEARTAKMYEALWDPESGFGLPPGTVDAAPVHAGWSGATAAVVDIALQDVALVQGGAVSLEVAVGLVAVGSATLGAAAVVSSLPPLARDVADVFQHLMVPQELFTGVPDELAWGMLEQQREGADVSGHGPRSEDVSAGAGEREGSGEMFSEPDVQVLLLDGPVRIVGDGPSSRVPEGVDPIQALDDALYPTSRLETTSATDMRSGTAAAGVDMEQEAAAAGINLEQEAERSGVLLEPAAGPQARGDERVSSTVTFSMEQEALEHAEAQQVVVDEPVGTGGHVGDGPSPLVVAVDASEAAIHADDDETPPDEAPHAADDGAARGHADGRAPAADVDVACYADDEDGADAETDDGDVLHADDDDASDDDDAGNVCAAPAAVMTPAPEPFVEHGDDGDSNQDDGGAM